jgi:hypothetical protein
MGSHQFIGRDKRPSRPQLVGSSLVFRNHNLYADFPRRTLHISQYDVGQSYSAVPMIRIKSPPTNPVPFGLPDASWYSVGLVIGVGMNGPEGAKPMNAAVEVDTPVMGWGFRSRSSTFIPGAA